MRRLCLGLLCVVGCDARDSEKVTRVGWKVVEHAERSLPDRSPWGKPSAVPVSTNLEVRVRARLSADKYLAEQPIIVQATGGTITLSGSVFEDVLKRRAYEIASSTAGVETVIDQMTIGN